MGPEFNLSHVEDRSVNLESLFSSRQVIYYRDLVRELVVRDFKVRYKRSILGVAWSLVNPLLLLLVFYFLFQMVLAVDIPRGRYSSFAFTGMLAWNWFQLSLVQAAGAITGSRDLIRLPGFPATVLPAVIVTTNLVHFLLALPILLIVLLIDGTGLKMTIAALPILMVVQFIMTIGLGYLVATANVVFRDTQHLIGALLQLMMFLSPIFYDVESVPPAYQALYSLNPFVPLLRAYRDMLLHGTLPDWGPILGVFVLASGLLYVGLKIFSRFSNRFIEEL